jgi:hypothetical protein
MNLSTAKIKINKRPWFANDTEANHLGKAGLIAAQKMDKALSRYFNASKNQYNPLMAYGSMKGKTKEITSDEIEWSLMGASTRPLVVLEDVEPSDMRKGIGKTPFRIKLDANWYKVGDVIAPADNRYLLRIQESPRPSGKGFVYTVVFHEDDPNLYLPQKFINPGSRFAKMFSIYGEGSDSSGSVQFAMPIDLKARISTFRKEYKITGDADNAVLEVALMDENGKIHDYKWMNYADAEFKAQWNRELEMGLWYMREGYTTPDTTGRPVRTGAGIEQLMESSHLHFYNKLTTKLLREYLMDIFYNRVGFKSRKIKVYTGEYGALAFHEAVDNDASKFLTMDTTNIRQSSSEFNSNSLQFGRQFTKYIGPNGIEVELHYNPCYDDREKQFQIDPVTGKPAESMKFTFLDFTDGGGDDNLYILKKKGGVKSGYVAGLQSPYGPVTGGLMSNSEDAYTMIEYAQQGVMLKDVSRCGQLRLNVN